MQCWSDPLGKWQTSCKLYEQQHTHFGFGDVPDFNHSFMHAISLKCGTSNASTSVSVYFGSWAPDRVFLSETSGHNDGLVILSQVSKTCHYLLDFPVRPLGLDYRRPNTKSVQALLALDIWCHLSGHLKWQVHLWYLHQFMSQCSRKIRNSPSVICQN